MDNTLLLSFVRKLDIWFSNVRKLHVYFFVRTFADIYTHAFIYTNVAWLKHTCSLQTFWSEHWFLSLWHLKGATAQPDTWIHMASFTSACQSPRVCVCVCVEARCPLGVGEDNISWGCFISFSWMDHKFRCLWRSLISSPIRMMLNTHVQHVPHTWAKKYMFRLQTPSNHVEERSSLLSSTLFFVKITMRIRHFITFNSHINIP